MSNTRLLPAFPKNNIPVVLSSSNLYSPYAGVFIKSLINCAASDKNYDIIILERDIAGENKRLLLQLVQNHANISIRFFNPSPIFEHFDVTNIDSHKSLPLEAYYKILAPHILPDYQKLIVIDIDTMVVTDIAQLYEVDLEDFCVGAAFDIFWHGHYNGNFLITTPRKMPLQDYFRDILPVQNPLNFVSSGVLLFDAEKYRETLSAAKIIETAQSNLFMLADEDVLNLLMEGNIKFLDMAWNRYIPVNPHIEHALKFVPPKSMELYCEACKHPHLLHWAAKPKPWVCPDVPYGNEWWQTAMETPFVGHIIARMFDALIDRKEHYRKKRGVEVAVWDPAPKNVKRDLT